MAVVAADCEGCAACLILSLLHPFGSMVLEPTTGMLLHNRGAYFSLNPSRANCVAPGKRPGHTLMPDAPPERAVSAPRWVVGGLGARDPEDDVATSVVTSLTDRGYALQTYPPHDDMLGHAQVVHVDAGEFTAASDPRSEGLAVTVSIAPRSSA